MVILGLLATLMIFSWIIVTAVCVLSSQSSREEEQREWSRFMMNSQLTDSSAPRHTEFQRTTIQF